MLFHHYGTYSKINKTGLLFLKFKGTITSSSNNNNNSLLVLTKRWNTTTSNVLHSNNKQHFLTHGGRRRPYNKEYEGTLTNNVNFLLTTTTTKRTNLVHNLHKNHVPSSIRFQSTFNNDEDTTNRNKSALRPIVTPGARHGRRNNTSTDNDENEQNNTEQPPASTSSSNALRNLGLAGSAIVLLSGKVKYLLVALKLTKFSSLASMFASMGMYSLIYGPKFAAGLVGMLLIHESGHALAMRHFGIPFSPMVFVPFLGAAVAMQKNPKSAYEDALISLAGPALGGAGAAAVALTGHVLNSQLLMHIGEVGFILNLFNLLPIGMLDGGRVASAVSKWALVAGLVGGSGLAYTGAVQSPLFYLILVMSGLSTAQRFLGEEPSLKYRLRGSQRTIIVSSYLGLIAALLFAQSLNNRKRKTPEEIRREMIAQGELATGTLEHGSSWNTLQDYANWGGENDHNNDNKNWSSVGGGGADPWIQKQHQQSSSSGYSRGGPKSESV
jgi:Zn-dependent protease